MKKALITGISGQDGRLLSRLLIDRSYEVTGTTRNASKLRDDPYFSRIGVNLLEADLRNENAIATLIQERRPDEVYNLAAFAVGSTVWKDPASIGDINGIAVSRLLESIRRHSPNTRFCQASSSEVFGYPAVAPQSELTPMVPRNPYGAAKLYAQHLVRMYRERYGLHACSAIFFNHESDLRGPEFVTRKVTLQAARASLGLTDSVTLGNLEARRDWGYAGDYMEAAWRMLQHDIADDYVVATGISHSVRDLCEIAFSHVGLDYRVFVRINDELVRREDSSQFVGDNRHIYTTLGWKPKLCFEDMIREMVDQDLQQLKLNMR